jgi:N-acetylmuramoyl-L-alanine amidase
MNSNIRGVIVDAGHGGLDSGAVGIGGLEEKNLNLEAALYINQRLNQLGIPSKLTRKEDEYLPKDERVKRILKLYDNNPNVILLSNHINAGGAEGAEVVYSLKNDSTLANLILENIGEKGQIKRKIYQRRLPENPNKDYYYILRETGNVEPVLIEYGFIDNISDAKKLKDNIKDYAEGVVKAVTEYIGVDYFPENTNENKEQYTVLEGDTLYSISQKYKISVDDLKRINNLKNNNIYKGQILNITEVINNNNTEKYIVKKGDTLYSIAKDNNISIDKLKELNSLKSNDLYIGDQIVIPRKDIELNEYEIYTVKKGDSLWKIAKDYSINVNDLINLNNLSNLTLNINQELLVPKQVDNNSYYSVEKGDTLWSIAKKFNITVDELKKINNITNNLLTVGEKLKIK